MEILDFRSRFSCLDLIFLWNFLENIIYFLVQVSKFINKNCQIQMIQEF